MFTMVGLSHAEHMAAGAAWGVSDDHQPVVQLSEANDPQFSIGLACVLDFGSLPGKDQCRVLEVKPTIGECPGPLDRIIGDIHTFIVSTSIADDNAATAFVERRPFLCETRRLAL